MQNIDECLHGNTGKNVFYLFYEITRRKLKHGNSLLYRSVNSRYCSWWRMRWRMMAWTFPCFPYSYIEPQLLTSQFSRFQNVILYYYNFRHNTDVFYFDHCLSKVVTEYLYFKNNINCTTFNRQLYFVRV